MWEHKDSRGEGMQTKVHTFFFFEKGLSIR